MNIYKYKIKGFTLAEVLITLLIIGIVASMVIPALIQDTQDAEFKTAYKKAFAMGSLVLKKGLSEYQFAYRPGQYDNNTTLNDWNVFKSYFIVTKDCSNNNNDRCWDATGEKMEAPGFHPTQDSNAFIDNSGMAWSEYSIGENIILVDTNGFKGPNRYGKDRWQFTFRDTNNVRVITGYPIKFAPYAGNDVLNPSAFLCHYPPCYFNSWLTQ